MDRVCSSCQKSKPVFYFHKDAMLPDGYVIVCLECCIAQQKPVNRMARSQRPSTAENAIEIFADDLASMPMIPSNWINQ